MSSTDDFRLELSNATKLSIDSEALSRGLAKLGEMGYTTWYDLMDPDLDDDVLKIDLEEAGFSRKHINLVISRRRSANRPTTGTPVPTATVAEGAYVMNDLSWYPSTSLTNEHANEHANERANKYEHEHEHEHEPPFSDITSDGTRTPPSHRPSIRHHGGAAEELSVTRNKSIRPLDTREVVKLVQKNSLKLDLAGKQAIFTIGVTGSGKTTTILYLDGRYIQLHQVPEGRFGRTKDVLVCNDRPAGYEIGGERGSCTVHLRATVLPAIEGLCSGNGVLVDTPGSEETAGVELDVANCISITKAVKAAGSASFLWVIHAKHLTGKATMFRMNFETILRFMPTAHMDGVAESIVPLFTGAERWEDVANDLDGILTQTHTSMDEDRPAFVDKLLQTWNNGHGHHTQANAEAWKKALSDVQEGVARILRFVKGDTSDGILNNALRYFMKALDETELPGDIKELIGREAASLAIMGRLYTCFEEYKSNLCIPLSTFREGKEQIAEEKRENLLAILETVAVIDDPHRKLRSPLGPSSCGQIKAATERMVNEVQARLSEVDRSIEWVLDGDDLGLTEVLGRLAFFAENLDLSDIAFDMQRAAIDLERFGSSKCDDVCARLVDTFTEQDAAEVRKLMLQCRGIASPALWPASHGQAPDELNDKLEASWCAINGAVDHQLRTFHHILGAETLTLLQDTSLGDEVGYWKSRMFEVSDVLYKLREFARLGRLGYLKMPTCYNDTQRTLHAFVLEVEAIATEELDGQVYGDLVKFALASLQAMEANLTTREGDGHIDSLQRTTTYSHLCARLDADIKVLIQSLVGLVRSGEIFDHAQREARTAVSMFNLIQDAVHHLAIHRLHPPAHTGTPGSGSACFDGTSADAKADAEAEAEAEADEPSDSASDHALQNAVLMTAAEGTVVRVVGLIKTSKHNGKEGVVKSADHEAGRLILQLNDAKELAVKPSNLELVSLPVDFVTVWEQARPEIVGLKDATFEALKEQLANQEWASWAATYERAEYLYDMLDDPFDALDMIRDEAVRAVVRIGDEICTTANSGLVEPDFDGPDGDFDGNFDGDGGFDGDADADGGGFDRQPEYVVERVDFEKLGDASRNLGVAVECVAPLLKRQAHWDQVTQLERCAYLANECIGVLGHALCRFVEAAVGWDVGNQTKLAAFNSHGVACGLRELQLFRRQQLAVTEGADDDLEAASVKAVASLLDLVRADWGVVLEKCCAAVLTGQKKRKGAKEDATFDVTDSENANPNQSQSRPPSPVFKPGLSASDASEGPDGDGLEVQIGQLRKLYEAPAQVLSVLSDVLSLINSQELVQLIETGPVLNALFARVEASPDAAYDALLREQVQQSERRRAAAGCGGGNAAGGGGRGRGATQEVLGSGGATLLAGATPGARLLGFCTDLGERVRNLLTTKAAETVAIVQERLACLKGGKDKRWMREQARHAMDDVRLLNHTLHTSECLDDVLKATPIATARQDLIREVGATFRAIRDHCNAKIAENELALKSNSPTLDATGAHLLLVEMASTPEGMDAKWNTLGDEGPTPNHLVHELEAKIKLANKDFLEDVQECLATQRWDDLATLLRQNSGHDAGEEKVKFDKMVAQVHSHFQTLWEKGMAYMDDIVNSIGLYEPPMQSVAEVADVLGCFYKSSPLWVLGHEVGVQKLQMDEWYEGLKVRLMDGFIRHCAETAQARCDVIHGDQFRFDAAFDSFRHLRLMAGEKRFPEPVRTEIGGMARALEDHLEVHVKAIEKRAQDLATGQSERSVRCLRTLMDSIRSIEKDRRNSDILVRIAGNASVLESLKEVLTKSLNAATDQGVDCYESRDIGSGDQYRKQLKRMVRYLNKEDFPEEVDQWEEGISHAREDALKSISRLDAIGDRDFMLKIKRSIPKREFDRVTADLSHEFKDKVDEAVKGYLPGNEIFEMTADEIGRIPVVIRIYGKVGKTLEVEDLAKFHEPLTELLRTFNRACDVAYSSLKSTLASVTGTKLDKPRRQRRGHASRQAWHLDDPYEAKDFLEMNFSTLEILSSEETKRTIEATFTEGTDAIGRVHRLLEEACTLESHVSSLLTDLPKHSGDLGAAYGRCMTLFKRNFGAIGEAQTVEIRDTLKTLSNDKSLAAIGYDLDLSHDELSAAFMCAVEATAIEASLRELLSPDTDRDEAFAATEPGRADAAEPLAHDYGPFDRCSVVDILSALSHLVNIGHGDLGERAKSILYAAKSVCLDLVRSKMATGVDAYRAMVNEEDRKKSLRAIRTCQKWLRTYERHIGAIVPIPSDWDTLINMIIGQVTVDATEIQGSVASIATRGVSGGHEICEKLARLNRAAMELTDEKALFEHTRDQICWIIHTFVKCYPRTNGETEKNRTYNAVQLLYNSLLQIDGGSEIIQEQGVFKQHLRAAWKKTASLQFPMAIEETKKIPGNNLSDATVSKFTECYNVLMARFKSIVEEPKIRTEAGLRRLAAQAVNNFRHSHVQRVDEQLHSVPLLLADFFAVWSVGRFLEESQTSMIKPDFVYPLPSQILCLFQMLEVAEGRRLMPAKQDKICLKKATVAAVEWVSDFALGTRHCAPPIRSSVSRIKTGQGKSLVIAAEATVLAVATGLPVDVACYSPYLSQRDQKAFAFVVDAFGVTDKITYGTFQQCADTHGSGPIVRDLTRQLITRSPSPSPVGGLSAGAGASAGADAGAAAADILRSTNNSTHPTGRASRSRARSQSQSQSQSQRILIVDEYDTLLKEDTYGNDMVLDADLRSDEVIALMTETWALRQVLPRAVGSPDPLVAHTVVADASDFQAQVNQLPAYAALLAVYHEDAHPLIEREIHQMVQSAAQFDAAVHGKECPYVVQLNDEGHPTIAYKHGDDYTTKLVHGYDTAWLQFHERDEAQAGGLSPASGGGPLTITNESMKHTLSLSMPCGSFSYAKLASAYALVLGVSGTLPAEGSVERKICHDFGIEHFYEMVDIYNNTNSENVFNKSSAGPERGVILEPNLASQHNRLAQMVNATANVQQRPVLVYFDTETALREFKKSGDFLATFPPDGDVQVEEIVPSKMGEGYMEGKLRFAVGKQHVTLLTADHTRGLDMVVMDPEVKEKGIHVIMTYFSLDKTEEIQAMGRTARQSDNGSFALVLDQSAVLETFEGTTLDQAGLEGHREAGTAYQHLDELRAAKYGEMCEERRTLVQAGNSARRHQESTAYREALLAYQNARGDGTATAFRADCLSRLTKISNSLSSRIVRVAINADATGSMGGIWKSGLPDVIMKAIERISAVAGGQGGVVFKITAYKDYGELPKGEPVTRSSEWAGQDEEGKVKLSRFIKSITPGGGYCKGQVGGEEAVEVGLKVIADEVESGEAEPVDLLVLLADAPPHPLNRGDTLDVSDAYTHTMETDYRTESARLAGQGTRMLCGYYGNEAKQTFTEMAELTQGKAFKIGANMASDASSEVIANVVCPQVLEIIGGADMVDQYNKQYNNPLWRG